VVQRVLKSKQAVRGSENSLVKAYAYIRVVSDEVQIRNFAAEVGMPGAELAPTKAIQGSAQSRSWWRWSGPHHTFKSEDVDTAVRSLLLQYKSIFPVLRNYAQAGAGVFLEIAVLSNSPEDARTGLYLSHETIALLAESGAHLDYDFGWASM
jgi:hypothetical protein